MHFVLGHARFNSERHNPFITGMPMSITATIGLQSCDAKEFLPVAVPGNRKAFPLEHD